MSRFQNQKFLVTGGSSGIGLATAKRLISEGAQVLITGTNADRLATATKEIGAVGLINDAGDPKAAGALAKAVQEKLGKLNGAFLNAGFGRFHGLSELSAEEFDVHYAVNVRGPLLQAQALAGLLEDGGSILLNTSVARELGMPGASIYGSTKGALRTITRVLAKELSERQIRVNAVSPGPVDTNFFARTGMPQDAIESFAAQVLAQVPLGRFAKPSEIAAVATFLLSDDASFVTGAEYTVDGGMVQV